MKAYYVFDPLCVFCYGFSPLIHRLYKNYKNSIEFELLPGGLWIDDNVKHVTPQVAVNLKKASSKVSMMSDSKFGEGFYELLETEHIFDSFNGSKAMAAVIKMNVDDPFNLLNLMYKSTFVDGEDVNHLSLYSNMVGKLNLNQKDFADIYNDIDETTYSLINKAKSLGAKSFPTLLVEKNNEYFIYPINYSDYGLLDTWFKKTLELDG